MGLDWQGVLSGNSGKETDMKAESGAEGSRPGDGGHKSWIAAVIAAATCALALAAPGAAWAAAPKATTGGAHNVTYGTATVNGTVNPGGAATSYYFQFGQTHAYGGQTAIGS